MAENTRVPEQKSEEKPWSVRKQTNTLLKSRNLPDLDEEEEMFEEEEQEIASGQKVNVFDFCAPLVEKGDVIEYDIEQNGSFKATKPHPYSWDQVQREFGAGQYRIQAKSALTRQYRKQETRYVAAPPKDENKTSILDQVKAALPPEKDPFDTVAKTVALIKSMTPPPPPPVEDKSSAMMIQFMQTIMQMQQSTQSATQTMMLEMQKSTSALIERLDNSQKEALAKIEAKLSVAQPKEKNIGAIELLTLMQNAEQRGMKNYLMIEELAEKKARNMGGDEEPESATSRLIKSVIPAVTAALSKPTAQPAVAQRQVAPRSTRPVVPAKPVGPQTNAQTTQGGATAAVKAAPQVLPKANKEQVLEKLYPIVIAKLMEADAAKTDPVAVQATQKAAANETKAAAAALGLTIPGLLQLISQGDMIDIATTAGLPVEAHSWLKGFYANIKELAGPASGAAPNGTIKAESKQPPSP